MNDKLLFVGTLGSHCYAIRIRGSGLVVYLMGITWILLSVVNSGNANYTLAGIILAPLNIVIGGSAVFLANTRTDSLSPRPEWPSIIYAVVGAFNVGFSILSLPTPITLIIVTLYGLVIFLSLPVRTYQYPQNANLVDETSIVGTPVGIHAQPISPDQQETV